MLMSSCMTAAQIYVCSPRSNKAMPVCCSIPAIRAQPSALWRRRFVHLQCCHSEMPQHTRCTSRAFALHCWTSASLGQLAHAFWSF